MKYLHLDAKKSPCEGPVIPDLTPSGEEIFSCISCGKMLQVIETNYIRKIESGLSEVEIDYFEKLRKENK